MAPKNDWNEYKRLILRKMDDDQEKWTKMFELVGALRTDVNGIKVDVGGLKVKAAIAGGAAGIIGTAIVTAVVGIWH